MTTHYCLRCGSGLSQKPIDGRIREECPACGWVFYEQRKVSAGVRVEDKGRLLLVQRGIEPWRGKWYMPAGFVEVDEQPEDAAEREAFEETGLVVAIHKIAGIYTYQDDPRGNGVVLLYDAELTGGEIRLNPEALQVGFFGREEVSSMEFAGLSAAKQVRDWINLESATLENSH
jgi:8-oxo-dGTP diphosphatase